MKRLGVLGGMGPAASAEFYNRLVQQTPASCDQDHIPAILWSDPTVPDRSTSILLHNDRPLKKLMEGIRGLKNAGCDHIVVPCNTAHFWYDDMIKEGVPITHIVDSVADQLIENNITNTTIGIMGTKGTIAWGLYQKRLQSGGWNCIVPSEHEMNDSVQQAINSIKASNLTAAEQPLFDVISSLIKRGAKAVVLGCTELPLAVTQTSFQGVVLINSIDSLVKAALKVWTARSAD